MQTLVKKHLFLLVLFMGLLVCPVDTWASQKSLLALFNLRPLSLNALGYDGEILYSLISALDKQNTVRLMPRREMEKQLFRGELSQSDNLNTIIKAGKLLGVDFVLAGQVDKRGSRIVVSFKMVDIARRNIAKTWDESFASRSDIITGGGRIADVIVQTIQGASETGTQYVSEKKRVKISSFTAIHKGKGVALRWVFDPSDPISQFYVYRSEHPRGPFQWIGASKKNNFVDTKVRRNANYYYKLGIILHNGQTIECKSLAKIHDVGQKLPHPPVVVTQTGHVQRIRIKCIPSMLNSREKFKIKEYRLYRQEPETQEWEVRQQFPTTRYSQQELAFYLEDVGLADATAYTYIVRSVSHKGKESPPSEEIVVTTLPRPRLDVSRENMLRQVELHWAALPDIKGYYLYRRHGTRDWEKIVRLRPDTNTYLDEDDLEDGLNYTYAMTAYDARSETDKSDPVTAATKPVPEPPMGLEAKSNQVQSVPLVWEPIQDEDVGGYVVYRGQDRIDLEEIVRLKGHRTCRYVDKGSYLHPLKDGTRYFYTVAALNTYKAIGPPAMAVQATTKHLPKTPRHVTIVMQQGQVLLSWESNPETDIQNYRIMRSKNGGGYSRLQEVDADTTFFTDKELSPDTTYTYQVIAIDEDDLASLPGNSDSVHTAPKPE